MLDANARDGRPLSDPVALRRSQERLTDAGYDFIDLIRARRWLRHGKPGNYRWDK